MSRGATLSIMGLYNNDPTIFDMMVFPNGFTADQKQITKENILVECAEFEFLYPAPEVAKAIIGIWSKKELPYWNRVYAASQAEYNPIENYSMVEKTEANTDIETANDIYGFNSASAVPSNKTKTTGNKLNNTVDHTRSGNIGVTTSQQMLESEIKLREWNFYDQLYKDVDSILCLKVY